MQAPLPLLAVSRLIGTALAASVSLEAAAAPSIPVSVTNTPSVTIANSPSVTIANVPTVAVGSPVSVGNTVTVTSTAAQPVIVDEGYSARHAQGGNCFATFDATGTATCTLGTVTSGQTFVIEAISCRVSLPAPSPYQVFPALLLVPEAPIGASGSGSGFYSLDHTLALQKTFSNGSNDYFAGTFPLKVAVPGPASSGSTYPIVIQAQGGGGASAVLGISCTATGYLVTN